MKMMTCPKTCIYCDKKLTGDSIEGVTWFCMYCPKTEKTRHEWHHSPIVYVLHDNYDDWTLEKYYTNLANGYNIEWDLVNETTTLAKEPNPYYNRLITINKLLDLDLMDREALMKWAETMHSLIAFS